MAAPAGPADVVPVAGVPGAGVAGVVTVGGAVVGTAGDVAVAGGADDVTADVVAVPDGDATPAAPPEHAARARVARATAAAVPPRRRPCMPASCRAGPCPAVRALLRTPVCPLDLGAGTGSTRAAGDPQRRDGARLAGCASHDDPPDAAPPVP